MRRRRVGLWVFLLLAFGVTWALEIGLARRFPLGGGVWVVIMVGVMLVPGLSALFVRLVVERQGFGDAGLRWGRGRCYLAAWLLPIGFGAAAFGLAILLRQGEFDPWMSEIIAQIRTRFPETELPPFERMRLYFIAGSLTQAVVMNLIPCLGEEFGWRGYLLMRLLPMGTGRALVLSGAIWGLWHAPVILQGHNYPDHPALGAALMIGFCIVLGVILGWLRLASGSVFPAAVGHASVNGPGSTPLAFLRGRNDITTGLQGLLGQAVMLVFALILWRAGALGISPSDRKGDSSGEGRMSEPGD